MAKKEQRSYLSIFVFLAFALALWLAFLFMPRPAEIDLPQQTGEVDLLSADFDDVVYFHRDYWDSYPEKLYFPEDFDNGTVDEQPTILHAADYERIGYATHVLKLKLPTDQVFGIKLKSSDYAMRLFIDGELVDEVGYPADNKEEIVPRTAERTYFFVPESDTTTLVVHAANWVHKEGSYHPNLYIGSAESINAYENFSVAIGFLILGGLLTAFLYHLGLFILNRTRKVVLVFALCCLLLALMASNVPAIFFPEYNWYIALALEYIVHFLTFATLTVFLEMLFPELYNRIVQRIYCAFAGVFVILTLILPPQIYSSLLIIFEIISVLMVIYTLVRLIMRMRIARPETVLAFVGIAVVCVLAINDILANNGITFIGSIAGQKFATPIAMLFFVFCYGLILSIDYARAEQQMLLAEQQVRSAEERYNALFAEQQAALQNVEDLDQAAPSPDTDLESGALPNHTQPTHAVPSDFKLSKRETDVLWLLLDGKSRQEIVSLLDISMGSVNTYCSRLYKKTGCNNTHDLLRLFGVPSE